MNEYVAVGTRVWRISPSGNVCVAECETHEDACVRAIELAVAEWEYSQLEDKVRSRQKIEW